MLPRMSSQVTDMGPGLEGGGRHSRGCTRRAFLVRLRLTSSAFLASGKGQEGRPELLELHF